MKILGSILIAIGIILLLISGINYTTEETVLDLGPLNVTAERERTISWPPIAGAVLIVGGVVIIAVSRKN